MKGFIAFIALALLTASSAFAEGFLTAEGTRLRMDGKPFRAVSVNKWDLFIDYRGVIYDDNMNKSGSKEHALASIKRVKDNGFNVIRFAASGYYPVQNGDWGKPGYFAALDAIVDCAKKEGMYLIPVVLWNPYLYPDTAREPLREMIVNPDSRSRQYAELFAHQLASRYKDETTVLFWELTNELNLQADLETAGEAKYVYFNNNSTDRGAPPMRTGADNFSTMEMAGFMKHIAEIMKRYDPNHLISSGYTLPHPWGYVDNINTDTDEGIADLFARSHPDPIDIISVHYYSGDEKRFGKGDAAEGLGTLKRAADKVGKPFFVGETYLADEPKGAKDSFIDGVFKAIEKYDIPITLMWAVPPGDSGDQLSVLSEDVMAKMREINKAIK
ncbi:MAG: cellulase family glycosylhydrolase [Abditibacteriota bacterium]|nr:cellulase family glycosylhydrolase [Abditibacteriota bacterium]